MSASVLKTGVNPKSLQFEKNARHVVDLLTTIKNEEESREGAANALASRHKKSRLTAREPIAAIGKPAVTPGRDGAKLATVLAMTNEIRARHAHGAVTG